MTPPSSRKVDPKSERDDTSSTIRLERADGGGKLPSSDASVLPGPMSPPAVRSIRSNSRLNRDAAETRCPANATAAIENSCSVRGWAGN